MNQYLTFVILALCNGAIALTLTKATIFRRMRVWIANKSDFFGELIQCPYCTAHWVTFFSMLICHPRLICSGFIVTDYAITGFALVALSAMSAGIIFRLFASLPQQSD